MISKNFNGWNGLGLFLAGFLAVACWASISTSAITIHKSWPDVEQPCVYVVSAESHTRFIYPNAKLKLAIERFMLLFGNKEGYKHENHLQYEDSEEL